MFMLFVGVNSFYFLLLSILDLLTFLLSTCITKRVWWKKKGMGGGYAENMNICPVLY